SELSILRAVFLHPLAQIAHPVNSDSARVFQFPPLSKALWIRGLKKKNCARHSWHTRFFYRPLLERLLDPAHDAQVSLVFFSREIVRIDTEALRDLVRPPRA